MARLLAVCSLAWPLLLASAVWQHDAHPTWAAAITAAASRICHQRPDRSFFTAAVQWPVCGRCAGLYLAAPVGAFAAILRRRSTRSSSRNRALFAAAALPTLATLAIEWLGLAPISTMTRALAAAPLGAAIAFLLIGATRPETNRVH